MVWIDCGFGVCGWAGLLLGVLVWFDNFWFCVDLVLHCDNVACGQLRTSGCFGVVI